MNRECASVQKIKVHMGQLLVQINLNPIHSIYKYDNFGLNLVSVLIKYLKDEVIFIGSTIYLYGR